VGVDIYPPVVDDAHRTADDGQNRFVRQTGTVLVLSCLAAVGGAVPIPATWGGRHLDLGALAGAATFVAGLILSLILLHTRPQQRWYEGRAAAESIKTLSWQYSVGGGAYPVHLPDAEAHLIAQINKVILELPATVQPDADLTPDQITDEMRDHRAAPLADRQKLYLTGRIDNQRKWYAGRTLLNRRRSTLWMGVTISAQVVGTALAAAKGFGLTDVDLLGIAAAVAASCAAWMQTKQYQALAASYDVTARELQAIRAEAQIRLATPDEAEWAEFVADAETAISREHTTWRARSGIS
jgi:hypothetical protein